MYTAVVLNVYKQKTTRMWGLIILVYTAVVLNVYKQKTPRRWGLKKSI